MMMTHGKGPGKRTRTASAIAGAAALAVLAALTATACKKQAETTQGMSCTLVELRPDTKTGYYDAVVRVDQVTLKDPLRDQLQVLMPSASASVADLEFTEEGPDPARLQAGDTFIVPLTRPDWKLDIGRGSTTFCLENFWDLLPAKDQWHPTKSETMEIAKSLDIVYENGAPKPVPSLLPEGWVLTGEKEPTADDPVNSVTYQKRRDDQLVGQLEIQYAPLSDEEKQQLAQGSAMDFLATWSDCAKTQGHEVVIAGHQAVACDLEGKGEFGWTYRYFYVQADVLVAVDVQADPQEWGKAPEVATEAAKSDRVFLRYSYGPVGPQEWQVLIEVRMNRTGAFHKRSRAGETVDKDFTLTDKEFAALETAVTESNFMQLESRSGGSGGTAATISVLSKGQAHTVEMKNYPEALFDNFARTIRGIVLPKVGESEK
jgi:hypothetical protein